MRRRLSNKDCRALAAELSCFGTDLIAKKDVVELLDKKYFLVNGKVFFFYYDRKLIPTLNFLREKQVLPYVLVDSGAVKFIANGADVMRPGITFIDEKIKKNEVVAIVDEVHKQPLAIGEALFCSDDMKKLIKGKVITLIHFLGDEIWKMG